MKKVILLNLILVLTFGCGQSFNSHTDDFNLVASSFCADQSQTALCEANEVIQKNCTSCHTNTIHASWGAYDTNEEWLASGRVVAGNPDISPLIISLKNYGGDMPDQSPAISTEDAEKIRSWILAL